MKLERSKEFRFLIEHRLLNRIAFYSFFYSSNSILWANMFLFSSFLNMISSSCELIVALDRLMILSVYDLNRSSLNDKMVSSVKILFERSRLLKDCYRVPKDMSFLKEWSLKPLPVIAKCLI